MSDTEELAPDDVLGWELDQLAKLKRLADAYGWDEDTPQYKAKVKQLQALGKQRLVEALGKGGGRSPRQRRRLMSGSLASSSRPRAGTRRS